VKTQKLLAIVDKEASSFTTSCGVISDRIILRIPIIPAPSDEKILAA
jgi:hypothetical protein